MKALFVHDHKFVKDDKGNFYSYGKLTSQSWNRYLEVFENLEVISRGRELSEEDDINKLSISSRENVTLKSVPTVSSLKGILINSKEVSNTLEDAINKTDVVIARVPSMLGRLAIKIAKKKKKPYAVEVVADAWDELWNYGNIKGKLFAPVGHYLTKKRISDSPFAIYVTSNYLQEKYPCKGEVQNASNVELKKLDEQTLTFRKNKINSMTSPYKLGLIGSLSSGYKGIDTAIKAIKLINSNPDVELHILGDGDPAKWKQMVERYGVSNKIFFDGTLTKDNVYKWLDEIDLYIHPSRQEGLPRAVIEAMSRGCPVVASTVAGIPELIDKSYLHDPKDYNKLAELIKLLLENKEELYEQSKKNFLESKNYEAERLEKVRYDFFMRLRKFSEQRHN